MLKAFPKALPQAMPVKQCRQDKTRLLTQQLLKFRSYLTLRIARRGAITKSPQMVTQAPAGAARQAANHA